MGIHNVFHVSQLRKYYPDESHILSVEETPSLEPNLTFVQTPVRVLDHRYQELWNKKISLIKVLWKNQKNEEATWETEEKMRNYYPELFPESE